MAEVHAGLARLRFDIDPRERARGELGGSTSAAISEFQREAGIEPTGVLNQDTVARLNQELERRFFTDSRTRTAKIHTLLVRVGHPVDGEEVKTRWFGEVTRAALAGFLRAAGLPEDAPLTADVVDRLERDALTARLGTKTQVGNVQRTLLRALRIAKLQAQIDPTELKEKRLGDSSKAAVQAFQDKYGLAATGELDPLTLKRLDTVATSRARPKARLKVADARALAPVTRTLRLNMANKHVAELQKSLAYLGYRIDAKEFKATTFGDSTRKAVVAFQQLHKLPVNGHVEASTIKALNDQLSVANPGAIESANAVRIRGSVRDSLARGRTGVRVQLWEKLVRGTGALLGERPTTASGFYDVPYMPPLDPNTKQPKVPYHLVIKVVDGNGAELDSKVIFNPTSIAWVNFIEGAEPYRGTSEFEERMKLVQGVLGNLTLLDLEETAASQEITHVSVNTGLSIDDVMRLVISARVAAEINVAGIDTQAVYAFVRQNLPPALPSDLLLSTQAWTLIVELTARVANGLVFLTPEVLHDAFENAVRENYIPVATGQSKAVILAALAATRETFALEKPIFVGDGNLKTLLDNSAVEPANYSTVTNAFLTHKSLGADFFADLRANALAGVDDFETVVHLGEITKNFAPAATQLKAIIDNNANPLANSARDFAKLGKDGWVNLLTAGAIPVPPNTDGAGDAERIANYAAFLTVQAERLFPTVAFVAEVGRGGPAGLNHVAEIQQFVDAQPDFDLRASHIDAYAVANNLALDDAIAGEVKVLQRVHRITPDASVGRTLIDNGIHSAYHVLRLGKERLVKSLSGSGIDRRTVLTVFGMAEFQYAQTLNRLVEFRSELARGVPAAIVSHAYTPQELQQFSGGVPNLELLFGPMDVCDCAHCESVLGPAAYLADVFRFLHEQPSEVDDDRRVLDELFARRPDLGNVKLNCGNTDVQLPYIDLVNEVLEALVTPADPNTSHQTTLTAAELRAFPEHERADAYNALKTADFPINNSFNLWQEEARVYLEHMGVARHDLMRIFQSAAPEPTEASIAAEYFGISVKEHSLITTAKPLAADQQALWGLNAIPAAMSVADFLERAKLTYAELLRMMYVDWIDPLGGANRIVIKRPVDTFSLRAQTLENLSEAKFDKIYRFLRLWRRTPWQMWELDLLLKCANVGNDNLDDASLVQLAHARKLQLRLGSTIDTVLAMYGELPTEDREIPENPLKKIRSTYGDRFQSRLITNPIDPALTLPIAANLNLADHRPALVAALAVSDVELTPLLARTDGVLNVTNLSKLIGYAALGAGLGLRPPKLLKTLELTGVADPFASLTQTLTFIEHAEEIEASGVAVDELDFVLNVRPDSPYGLRDEVVAQHLLAIREGLRSNPSADQRGQVIAGMASSLALTDRQTAALLDGFQAGGNPVIDGFFDPQFTDTDANGAFVNVIVAATFPGLFSAYRRLHKASLLIGRHRLDDPHELAWFLANAGSVGALQLGDLPVDNPPGHPLYAAWRTLQRFIRFRDDHPAPQGASLTTLLDAARNAAAPVATVLASLSALTGWNLTDLEKLHTGLGFVHGAPSSYAVADTYQQLEKCFGIMHRIGVGGDNALAWADRETDGAGEQSIIAQQIRQAAKAHYSAEAWLTIATPIVDRLREAKRDALLAWLIENSLRTELPTTVINGTQWPNPKRWKDAGDVFAWVLIDVEMSPCQGTSRVKQAMSSTQMFVQRCFLNLEQALVQVSRQALADTNSDNNWRQWRWMKNYRMWEANRKVFLYPENWIEPELRDDKSPFFEELESELFQEEITDASAESAMRHYLEKVHEVSRLEVMGVYYELDDDGAQDNDLLPNINRLHMIARTKADPAVHYYRQYDLNDGTWTAWERIDVEIGGDHAIPVVYNRTLYVFWLVFKEKPQKTKKQPAAQPSTAPTDLPDPPTQLEIQLAWSMRTGDGWTAKKLSRQKILHPWPRPLHSYNLRPRYRPAENLLWLDLYISTSVEFNDTRFTDAYTGKLERLTATTYDETGRPWHSSSFAFDGTVIATRMKGLAGQYHLKDWTGNVSDKHTATDSHTWVSTTLGLTGAAIERARGGPDTMPRTVLPTGMHFEYTRLRNNRIANPSTLNVLESGGNISLLRGARGPFDLVFSQHGLQFDEVAQFPPPMLYQDPQRSFFIKPKWRPMLLGYNQVLSKLQYEFFPFHHPYTTLFLRELNRSGVDGLFNRRIQSAPHMYAPGNAYAFNQYLPTADTAAHPTVAADRIDFELGGAYSVYNWEIFFHAPLMVATKLTQNQRFEEAMRWFHYIFDPTNTESVEAPQRFWVTRPFFEKNAESYRKERIETLLQDIGANVDQLRAWKNNPFKPHLIARFRPIAYQKTVVMKYLDNLIAWGDQLFRRDTIESINEATTLYMLAWELLGPRPVTVPNVAHVDQSYNELIAAGALDPFGNKKVEVLMENMADSPIQVVASNEGTEPMPVLEVSYFGLPQNQILLNYWDTVTDRLNKIRNCMNIKGIVRQLPLFEPAWSVLALVQAAAAGVDLDTVLDAAAAPASHYRSRVILQKAMELTGEVRALGERLLAVLEKADAAGLDLVRASNESQLLRAVLDVRKQAITEAQRTQTALERSQETATGKVEYLRSRDYINQWEGTALGLSATSALAQTAIAAGYALAGGLALIPRFVIGGAGFGGSPVAQSDLTDGSKLSNAAELAVTILSANATAADKLASLASTMGTYQRRAEEWEFQGDQAELEVSQLAAQIEGAKVRVAMAETEVENHEEQIEQARAIEDYLKTKYTNAQLYDWMTRQVSTVYFQGYQLAFDMARQAELAMKYELGDDTLSFIQFGYWDGLKKGLLAADMLGNDLRRMEVAWYERHTRTFEISKNISLAQIDPLALLALKTTGTCSVTLPEWLYDLDYPGQIRRRITSVSISIPCIVGPYTSVNCTLSLTNHGVRVKDSVAGGYGDPLAPADDRFASKPVPVTSIATSHAQNDSGMFELTFNDERFLPFEGAGAVSQWAIDLPPTQNQFDLAAVSDVVLHVRYRSEPGSGPLVALANQELAKVVPKAGTRLFVLDREFATEWQRFLTPPAGNDQELVIALDRRHLPFRARTAPNVKITSLDLIVDSSFGDNYDVSVTFAGQGAAIDSEMTRIGGPPSPHHLTLDPVAPPSTFVGPLSIKMRRKGAQDFQSLPTDDLHEAYLVLGFSTS
ncbi:Tc toxin subunit A-related protein [Arthrobacter sp. MDT3-24]